MTVRAIGTRSSNAAAIVDCRTLGYLNDHDSILDPTYGLGRFWSIWRPYRLVRSDLNPARSADGVSVDVRAMPWPDDLFDAVVFDPPYKLNGTSTGRGPAASDEDYGVHLYQGREERHQFIRDGITECVRVVRHRGYLLVKCMDQVNGGRKRWQTRIFADHAESLGCRLVDMLHVQGYRAQPKTNRDGTPRRQQHAAADYSTLLVLRLEGRPS